MDAKDRYGKLVPVRMYPREIMALEAVSKLAGWKGNKSKALREFMYIWIEAAVVTIETKSATKGTWQMIKSLKRMTKQMQVLRDNCENREKDLVEGHILKEMKMCIEGKAKPWKIVPQ
jgi:hypothetical protein